MGRRFTFQSELKQNKQFGAKWKLFAIYNLAWLLLCVSALYFFEQRLHGDSGSYLFGAINKEFFYTERSRYVILLSQWLPVLSMKAGLSLKFVLIAYSLGHVLFFYILFLISFFGLGQYHASSLYILLQTLGVGFTYFAWPFGEVPYGIGLLIFLISIILRVQYFGKKQIALSILIMFFILTSHPLVWVVMFFVFMYLLADPNYRKRIVLTGSLFSVMFVLQLWLFPDYLGHLITEKVGGSSFHWFNMQEFKGMMRNHVILTCAFFTLMVLQLLRRQFYCVGLALFSSLIIAFIIKQYFPLDAATQQYYLSFGGIVSMILLVDYFEYDSKKPGNYEVKNILVLLVLSLTVLSYIPIWKLAPSFVERTDKMKSIIKYCKGMDGNRFIISGFNYFKDTEKIWISTDPYVETLYLSALNKHPIHLVMYERAWEQINWMDKGELVLEGPSDPRIKKKSFLISELKQQELLNRMPDIEYSVNSSYFNYEDEPYKFLNLELKNSADYIQNHLFITEAFGSRVQGSTLLLSLKFMNEGPEPIYSGRTNNLYFRALISGSDKMEANDSGKLPLLMDLSGTYIEKIEIPDVYLSPDEALSVSIEIFSGDTLLKRGESIPLNKL